MREWVEKRLLNVDVTADWPQFDGYRNNAAIVVNAARDHDSDALKAIQLGVPVLIEKPVALSSVSARRIFESADAKGVKTAPSQIFMFASYVDQFADAVNSSGGAQAVRVVWTDPAVELRYGETKTYDPAVPVFADVLPHVMAIVGKFLAVEYVSVEKVVVAAGGAQVELRFRVNDVLCVADLRRESDQRRRFVEVVSASGGIVRLDFSTEPGSVVADSRPVPTRERWEREPRPLSGMLSAFLGWTWEGRGDRRLDSKVAIKCCELVDEVLREYFASLTPWFVERLGQRFLDDGVRYALAETLQRYERVNESELGARMDRVLKRFSGAEARAMTKVVANAGDPGDTIRALAH